ncbi:beta-ketoacyl-[acyl-carrier-protein] synthase family protein [Actinomadura barringtoniae]|uniref:Beta-ketoacyl-[acyl-carrier-protein] synthase family protein n=1 Tax=Actinomadura barringtoniae TaxID=1427535 RepID=A0A939PCF7_9ACTN|nr:beta-ketoacyl-[acyl-carrier-protein] synthase family protein [Actinomadura barringtoniae]MBO2445921.1 beta-ketoacyl-[acyl-carrier-protein] synthase family protein [Actinomadura barringtoniae]
MTGGPGVVVTGLGVVSPLGDDLEVFWRRLCSEEPRPTPHPHIRADLMQYQHTYSVPSRSETAPGLGRATSFALRATTAALQDAGLSLGSTDGPDGLAGPGGPGGPAGGRTGVVVGTATGDEDLLEDERSGGQAVSPLDRDVFGVTGHIADRFHLTGPNAVVNTACSAGCHSLGLAGDLILAGAADVMVAGGTDSVCRVAHAAFNQLRAVDPEACRPFDTGRKGTVYGEGAAILILESADHARSRGATWYAELKGTGQSADAFHPTAPDPAGDQARTAIERALRDAGLDPGDIDGVACHGTGTRLNDVTEATSLAEVFGDRIDRIPVCAVKSQLGHSAGASGAFSALVAALILRRRLFPPTARLRDLDPDCPVRPLREATPMRPRNLLVSAYSFGGSNVALILGSGADD